MYSETDQQTFKQITKAKASSGKTRLEVLTVVLWAGWNNKLGKEVHFLILQHHQAIRRQDAYAWDKITKTLQGWGCSITFNYIWNDVKKNCKAGNIIIVDEVDYFIFDDNFEFPEQKPRAVFGFTAAGMGVDGPILKRKLETLGFKLFDPQLPGATIEPTWKVCNGPGAIKELAVNTAILIYCTEAQWSQGVSQWAISTGKKVLKNCEDPKVFRNMAGKILIVTKPPLMRGVDYKNGKTYGLKDMNGICLLLMRQAKNNRELLQISSRVGRDNEICTHLLDISVENMISQEDIVQEQMNATNTLFKMLSSTKDVAK